MIGFDIKKSYKKLVSNVKLCYTYKTVGGNIYGRFCNALCDCFFVVLFSVPRCSGFDFKHSVLIRRSK